MEQPIFTAKAHVFHIDQQTKRSWVPASQYAVNVSFYYDSSRNSYRIISVEDTKAIINSTITSNMTITKTSQKFLQINDVMIYGLGFNSEQELNKFIEKFHEIKEATRPAPQAKSVRQNGTIHTAGTTQQSSHIIAPPNNIASTTPNPSVDAKSDYSREMLINSTIKQPLAIHQRSQSLSGLQLSKSFMDSPKHTGTNTKLGSQLFLPQTSAEAQLKHENDRLKIALAQSSANAKKWEIELQTLKNNNTRLTNALQESTANVEEWKKQLSTLKEENNKMRLKILELEASNGNNDALAEIKKELQNLRLANERLESLNEEKNKEIKQLKAKFEDRCNGEVATKAEVTDQNKPDLIEVNSGLADCVNNLQSIHKKLNNLLT